MTLLTQDCNSTGSGLRAGDSQNNTKKTAVCKYRICEHKENRTGHDFRRHFGKQRVGYQVLSVQCFLYELLILPLLNAKNVRADVIFIYCTLKKFLMAGMWLAHSVLRQSSTFGPTCKQTQDVHTYIQIIPPYKKRGRGREAEEHNDPHYHS